MNSDLKKQIKQYFIGNFKRVKIEDCEDLTIYFFDQVTKRDYKLIFDKYFECELRLLLAYKPYNLMNSYVLNHIILEIEEIDYIKNVIKASIITLNKYCIQYEEKGNYINID